MNFEINLILLIKPFCYTTKMSKQRFKYVENEKSFLGEIKIIFKGLLVTKNYLRPDSAPVIIKGLTSFQNQTRQFKANTIYDVVNKNICLYGRLNDYLKP